MKKKIVLLILLLCFSLVGCKTQEEIYDDNDRIAKNVDSNLYLKNITNKEKNNYEAEFEKFTGLDTIFTIKSDEDSTIKMKSNVSVNNDDFKVVLVNSNKEVINLIEGNFEGEVELPLKNGTNKVKIVSKGSEGEVSLEVEENENISVR
ncbi:hypothetical protein [Miniphocaeibacter halophilus]|uniref:Uncharacterized protein n=1 Tax=Miniphocaeibacter halophilus TaxID=2931922 RepID=A0AC61MQP9_9FIRM|nr:hypothetical protein [Miniphocaeibacter halophilus]QQK07900.1 hypothetical protein JFY71_11605 [Miniphocaeibacter halophilus]